MPPQIGGTANKLPAGGYLCQVVEVKEQQVADFNDKTKKVLKLRWDYDVQMPDGVWERRTKFTGLKFANPDDVSDPKFIPEINKMTRACGFAIPLTTEDLAAWQTYDHLTGKQFGQVVEQDEETGVLVEKFVTVQSLQKWQQRMKKRMQAAQAPQAAPTASPTPATPPAAVDDDEDLWDQPQAA